LQNLNLQKILSYIIQRKFLKNLVLVDINAQNVKQITGDFLKNKMFVEIAIVSELINLLGLVLELGKKEQK